MNSGSFAIFTLVLTIVLFIGSVLVFCVHMGLGWFGLIPTLVLTILPTFLYGAVFGADG